MYNAYLIQIESDAEIHIGEFKKLSTALAHVRCACHEYGISKFDWVVEKYNNGILVNTRSSLQGLQG